VDSHEPFTLQSSNTHNLKTGLSL